MFCRKCGKYINGGMHVCRDCQEKQKKHQADAKRSTPKSTSSYAAPPSSYTAPGYYTPPRYYTPPAHSYRAPSYSRPSRTEYGGGAYGLGMALTAAILSTFFMLLCAAMYEAGYDHFRYAASEFLGLFWMLIVPMFVMLQVFGIVSIARFKNRTAPYTRPVATLVLGIVSIALSVSSMLIILSLMERIFIFLL